jgi:Tol biopolymer transport system component
MVGKSISHYRIVGKLGVGGMGVVYRAQDTKLGRDVALKFLPPELSRNHKALERFQREARAASALNHPNICTIYEIDEADGQPFIAMELLEGRTLRDRLVERPPLRFHEVLDLAIQIAEALQAAQAKGVVHRDIKPANIFVTRDGRAKILDFGLARVDEASHALDGDMPTAELLTSPGVAVGTVAYMSPEQASGHPLDGRTDLFSFGLVLYEMATGRQAFTGNTAVLFSGILHRQPVSALSLNPDLPPQFEQILGKAMEKDREVRYQSAADLRADLRRLKRDTESASVSVTSLSVPIPSLGPSLGLAVPRGRGSRRLMWQAIGGAAVLMVFAGVGWWWWRNGSPDNPSTFLAHATFSQLTDQAGLETFPSLAPDGRSLIYASSASGNRDIYLQRVEGKKTINLTADSSSDDTQPAFSPDGERIAFRSEREGGGIFVMGATGESVRRISDVGYNPAWSPDGKFIVCAQEAIEQPGNRYINFSALWVLDVSSGEKRQITKGDAVQPNWSPHGQRIAYWAADAAGRRDIWTMPAQGGAPLAVTSDPAVDWNPVWSRDGKFVFFSSDRGGSMNLWRVSIDETTGKTLGPPEAVTTPSANSALVSFSADGKRVAYVEQSATENLMKVGFPLSEKPDNRLEPVTEGSRHFVDPQVSADGQWLATYTSGKKTDLYVVRTDGTGLRQLTDDVYKNTAARWSPDGQRLAFYSNRSGAYQVWTISPDGSGLRQVTFGSVNDTFFFPLWSPDSKRLLYSSLNANPFLIDAVLPWKEQTPQALSPLPEQGMTFVAWSWSADGHRLAGWRLRSDGAPAGIAVYDLGSQRYQTVFDTGSSPVWLKDDRRLLFVRDNKLFVIDSQTKAIQPLPRLAGFAGGFTLSSDNRWLYFQQDHSEGDVWMMDLQGRK